jgi:hypothetical protein
MAPFFSSEFIQLNQAWSASGMIHKLLFAACLPQNLIRYSVFSSILTSEISRMIEEIIS